MAIENRGNIFSLSLYAIVLCEPPIEGERVNGFMDEWIPGSGVHHTNPKINRTIDRPIQRPEIGICDSFPDFSQCIKKNYQTQEEVELKRGKRADWERDSYKGAMYQPVWLQWL